MNNNTCQAHVDWLAFTVKFPVAPGEALMLVKSALVCVFGLTEADWLPRDKGWFGYAQCADLGDHGLVGYGGDTQRGTFHIELNASGCAQVFDWTLVQEWGELTKAIITRIDLAHDDFEGKALDPITARVWHTEGRFNSNGRPPKARFIDDCDSGEGKTFYVGSRKNGKLARIYEKGKQLGKPTSPWVRLEVEFRKANRIIPWEAVLSPGSYLAGAYPCFGYLSEKQDKVKTFQRAGEITLGRLVGSARAQYGKLIHVMLEQAGGDAGEVVTALIRHGIPSRLKDYRPYLPVDGGESGKA